MRGQILQKFVTHSLNMHLGKYKFIIHIICGYLLFSQYYLAFTDQLGADPVESILHFTGMGALNLLLLTLCLSPLAKTYRLGQLIKLRRMLGLWSFTYALSHFLSFIAFEVQFDWQLLLTEIVERPYITVGFAGLVILFLLAITSFRHLQRKMGSSWQTLHNWIYPASMLVTLHFFWSVKSDLTEPLIYTLILLCLLYFRRSIIVKPLKKFKKSTKKLA